MNKKGFTLIELLAVVAIIALLAIVAIPNVRNYLLTARRNSYLNDMNSLLGIAEKIYVVNLGKPITYSNATNSTNVLDMQGGYLIKYIITFDHTGRAVSFRATDGIYQCEVNNPAGITKITESCVKDVDKLNDNEIMDIDYIFDNM